MNNNNFIQPYLRNLKDKKNKFEAQLKDEIQNLIKIIADKENELALTETQVKKDYPMIPIHSPTRNNKKADDKFISAAGGFAAFGFMTLGYIFDNRFLKTTGALIGSTTAGYILLPNETKKEINDKVEGIVEASKNFVSVQVSTYMPSTADNLQSSSPLPSIDLSALNNEVYKKVETLCKNIKDNWSDFLSKEKNALMKSIEELNIPIQTKNKMVSEGISRSLISFPVTDVLASLSKLGQSKNLEDYKTYLNQLYDKYKGIIETAYIEQAARLNRVNDINQA